jgi:hypothetical protein
MGPPANRNPPRRASTPLRPGPAFERLREKVDRHARQMGVTPAGVSMRAFRSRWGSCT